MMLWSFFQFLAWLSGGLGIIAAIAGIAWALFKWLGEKWIDQKFERSMEKFRADQERELERLRHKINSVFDRTTRLHEKEFEHLPEIWARLHEAFEKSAYYLAPLKTYPDLRRMSEDERATWIERSDLNVGEKELVSNSVTPQEDLQRIIEFKKYDETIDVLNEFASVFRKKGIFMKPELKSEMDKYFRMMRSAVTEQHFSLEHELRPPNRDDYKKFEAEGPSLLKKIEEEVQARLWDSTVTEV